MQRQSDTVWRLTVGNHVWCLLEFHDLTVCESTSVMDQNHCVWLRTSWTRTHCWFMDDTTVNVHGHLVVAHRAFEKRRSHLRNNVGDSQHNALNPDKLVNVLDVQLSHVFLDLRVVRTDLVHGHIDGVNHRTTHPFVFCDL
ncbi:hypothetical protein WICPIJ_007909 [Wickerhamomyces pijperi]|uniref:Uncharacterized protein n=1 Tax=Wickerhamomyces pijperi TaxID=599730 RepID=A0A9P8Q1P5_WICPI|nr:hypothetical protein WICPIJ_007909 [Wickerhamomyces pijperi]